MTAGRGRRAGGRWCARRRGAVRPEVLILAGNAYLGEAVPEIADRVMPFSTQIMATEPLGERGRALLPTDVCVEDVRYVLDYYRLSADGRLLCGGGHGLWRDRPRRHPGEAPCRTSSGSFRELRGVADRPSPGRGTAPSPSAGCRRWGGSGATPTSRRATAGTGWWAATSSGGSSPRRCTATGRALTFSRVYPGSPSPGGRRFAVPYSVLGSWWYGLRDRLGV